MKTQQNGSKKPVKRYVPTLLPLNIVEALEKLVENGVYETRSHAIRTLLSDTLGLNKNMVSNTPQNMVTPDGSNTSPIK